MHDNSTLNDPHECARRIVEALKALGLWPSNGAGVELPSRARARSERGIGSLKSAVIRPNPRTATAPLLLGVLVKVPPTLPPAGFGRGHTPIADALPHRYGRCDLAPLPVASRDRGRPDTDDTQAPARPRSYTTLPPGRGRVAREGPLCTGR